jgi:hypothetical protein
LGSDSSEAFENIKPPTTGVFLIIWEMIEQGG